VTIPFNPQLQILPLPQLSLWHELTLIPKNFVLYRGTALALHLGHRDSIDFDFFSATSFDPDKLLELPLLKNAVVLEKAANTLTVRVDRQGSVKLSFFGVPKLKRLREPHIASANQVQIASLLDLAGTKAAVVQKRAEAKDYIDIDALLSVGGVKLPLLLAAGMAIYGEGFNPEITLKALCYFEEETLSSLNIALKNRLVAAVKAVDLDHLPSITSV
jgi:Nucleotidyl transferase AbiEii toxin, Type IV TA system